MDGHALPHRRKRAVHLYLRDDIVKALEQVATDSEVSVSRVVEILLGFYWEYDDAMQTARTITKVHRRFRRRG